MGPGKLPGHSSRSVQEYEKAARCIAVLKNTCADFLDIDALFDSHPECSTVFVGKVADGGECTDDNDRSSATSIRQDESHKLYGCDPPELNCVQNCSLIVVPLSRPACEDELVAYYSCWLPEASTCKQGLPADCQDEKDAYDACVDAHGCIGLECDYPHGLEGNECACSSTCLSKKHEVKCGPTEDGTTMCSCLVEGVEVGTCEGAPREVCHLTQGCCQQFFDIN
ncbi:hypothetical protein WME99_30385 [Sorangium sp. So ce136]|uniref:hypothetical protein n=1 Tax=Sorangium sp. So ce136 TaxID=3133284 RepID=UPI003F088D83